ncbi:MAG: gliding motility-associated C-terminal domain-containing protein [Saprospiraceae bacterium]|nr:gliding motility-associated C-terminal domain-containing protein [Lewinella sp.]
MVPLVKICLLILLLVNVTFPAPSDQPAPEICNNGLDDDHDGLIDLNDDDCYCEPLEQPSLIPNPSFEEQDCCPDHHSQIDCATGWIQASEGTPDYHHSCDYQSSSSIPLPIPDGEGYVGIIDGSFTGNYIPALKEYIGTCLIAPLEIGTQYRLEFYTGFLVKKTSPDIEIALFGTSDCANLPFGIGDKSFGCPANSPDWIQLGSVSVSGENQWVKSQFKVRPNREITAVAIGPACRLRSSTNNTYHLLDQVVLKENADFDLGIKANGQSCTNELFFEIRPQEGYRYQWYKDGVAIPQAVDNTLPNPPGRGRYQVRLENDEGCKVSEAYAYAPPSQFVRTTQTFCAGESFNFNDRQLTEAGTYLDTLTSSNNCDSIVQLKLEVSYPEETYVTTKIFPYESFHIGSNSFNSPGEYTSILSTTSGCDSIVHLQLAYYGVFVPNAFSPNGDLVNDVFSIYGDSDLVEITSLKVVDRWGALVYQGEILTSGEGWNGTIHGKIAPMGVYAYTAQVLMTDNKKRILHGMLTLVR